MDERLRLLQRLVRSDPTNLELLHRYIRKLEQSQGAALTPLETSKAFELLCVASIGSVADIFFSLLSKVGMSSADALANPDYSRHEWRTSIVTFASKGFYQGHEYEISYTVHLGEIDQPRLSSSINFDIHLHLGACAYGSNCLTQLEGYFDEGNLTTDDHQFLRQRQILTVYGRNDFDNPDQPNVPLIEQDTLAGWERVLGSLLHTVQVFRWTPPDYEAVTTDKLPNIETVKRVFLSNL